MRQSEQRGLGDRVDDIVLERPLGVNIGDVDDGALRFAKRRRCRLRQEQRCLDVGADQIVPARDGDFADRGLEKRRRVVDESVQPAVRLQRLLDERRQLRDVEQIGLDQRDGVGALMIELRLEQTRFAGRGAVVQHQAGARIVQPPANRGAHTFSAAGDQHHLALHVAPQLAN